MKGKKFLDASTFLSVPPSMNDSSHSFPPGSSPPILNSETRASLSSSVFGFGFLRQNSNTAPLSSPSSYLSPKKSNSFTSPSTVAPNNFRSRTSSDASFGNGSLNRDHSRGGTVLPNGQIQAEVLLVQDASYFLLVIPVGGSGKCICHLLRHAYIHIFTYAYIILIFVTILHASI